MPRVYSKKEESASASRGVSSKSANVEDLRQVSKAQQILSQNQNAVQTHPADRAFVYYPDIRGDVYKYRVPYIPHKICFAPYNGGEVKSAGFNGCYMMAFRFTWNDRESFNGLMAMFDGAEPTDFDRIYIAHVANDTARVALFDALQRNLIEIETIFRPYYTDADLNGYTKMVGNPLSDGVASTGRLTAGLGLKGEEWFASVYNQEKRLTPGGVEKLENRMRMGVEKQQAANAIANDNDYQWVTSKISESSLDGLDHFESDVAMACLAASTIAEEGFNAKAASILISMASQKPEVLFSVEERLHPSKENVRRVFDFVL